LRKKDKADSDPGKSRGYPPGESSYDHFRTWWMNCTATNDPVRVCDFPYFVSIADLAAPEDGEVIVYGNLSNAWLGKNPPQTIKATDRGTSGGLGGKAEKAAEAERRRSERSPDEKNKYTGLVVGHVPDVGISGMPDPENPPAGSGLTRGWWLPMTLRANSHVGGGLSSQISNRIDRVVVKQLLDDQGDSTP
jgi:hypothetical protein